MGFLGLAHTTSNVSVDVLAWAGDPDSVLTRIVILEALTGRAVEPRVACVFEAKLADSGSRFLSSTYEAHEQAHEVEVGSPGAVGVWADVQRDPVFVIQAEWELGDRLTGPE